MTKPTTLQGIPLAGLRLGAPLGSGSHGVVWAATTAEGEQVAVSVLPAVEPARQAARSARLEVLRSIGHPGLAGPVATSEEVDERLLVSRLVMGPSIGTIRAARMGLSAPEALTLARDLALSLAELHRHGLAHGDVAPANVLLTQTGDELGRPVLIDLAAEPGHEAGTAGFAAPEVRQGSTAGPAADVWSLACLCVWATRVSERDEVTHALGDALRDDPASRPTAASLAATLGGRAEHRLRVPPASILAGAALRERAQRSDTVVRPHRPRHRRSTRGRRLAAAGIVCGTVLVGGVGWAVLSRGAEPEPAIEGSAAQAWADQVTSLVAARDEAIVDQDADALDAVTAPGSPARADDRALLEQLVSDGTSITGLHTAVSGTEPLTVSADAASVRTSLTQAAHQRTTAGATEHVAARTPRCVVLELTLADDDAWVVESVSPCER